MNKTGLFLFVLLFFAAANPSSSQKLITNKFTSCSYDFVYDHNTGAYAYNNSGSGERRAVLHTSKGSSENYDMLYEYSSLFDKAGNVYTIAYNDYCRENFTNFFLKNGQEIISFNDIDEHWVMKDGIIYFRAADSGKYFIVEYNAGTNELKTGKRYDNINLVFNIQSEFMTPPYGYPGFTKEGELFYIAAEGNESFLVIGNKEQKHYPEIEISWEEVYQNGNFVYIVNYRDSLTKKIKNANVVCNEKVYNLFGDISEIWEINNNLPVYYAHNESGKSIIVSGNDIVYRPEGSIYFHKITPTGKLAILEVSDTNLSVTDNISNVYKLMIDGEQIARYHKISQVEFTEDDRPVYIAEDFDMKSYIVKGDKIASGKYSNIIEYYFMNNGLFSFVRTDGQLYNLREHIDTYNDVVFYADTEEKSYGPYDYICRCRSTGKDFRSISLETEPLTRHMNGEYRHIISDGNNTAFVTGRILDNEKNYTGMKYKVVTGKWEGKEYDDINILCIYNGKIIYTASNYIDNKKFDSTYDLYINNKLSAKDYNCIDNFYYDVNTGIFRCIASNDSGVYLLEFKI
ncbi:MAG: hypothetical protein EHM58_08970 [Ignavibacteriae bacterium]|nr:MAG: hypothetical protein EHM58_08970 [Ignavibacteriota bacterium]